MSDMGESLNRKGDGWQDYEGVGGVGGGSKVAWENHGTSVELARLPTESYSLQSRLSVTVVLAAKERATQTKR